MVTSKEEAGLAPDPGLAATVYTVPPEAPVLEVAQLMVARDVGAVLVVEDGRPIGIVTDRDIVVRVTAVGVGAKTVPVRKVMSPRPVVMRADEEVSAAIALMGRHGIRRLPIVGADGRLVSILTLDDILLLGLEGCKELSNILKRQLRPPALPPRPDIPAPPPVATVEPSSSQPPSVLQAPLPEVCGASPVAAAPRPQPQAQPAKVVPPSPQPEALCPAKEPSLPPKPAPGAAEPVSRSGGAQGEAITLSSFPKPGRDSFGGVRFSQPVATVARTTIIRPLAQPHKTKLDYARSWFFWSRDWLRLMPLLILLGLLLYYIMLAVSKF
ncbi:MAG: CBS domain-containing protein [Nitrospirae bacterium]|nr:MAG: CBS domain-containing protein [Nitrospirota bacterium]